MASVNAFGTVLKIAGTAVAEVTSISAPSISRDTIETTHHGSVDGHREFLPGLSDGGEVSLDINWNPADASHAAIYATFTSSANQAYSVMFPNLWELTFNGMVTGFDATAPIDDRLTASVTIKVTGKVTLTDTDL